MLAAQQAAPLRRLPQCRGSAALPVRLASCRQYRAHRIECAASSSNRSWVEHAAMIVRQQPAIQLVVHMFTAWQRLVSSCREACNKAFPQLTSIDKEELKVQLLQLRSNMKVMALVVLPFARAGTESLTAVYTRTFEKAAFGFAKMYLFCLFMRVLLSWFPGIDWNAQPWTFLRLITEPYLQIYRGILPPLFGQLDFTPLFGFLILQDVVEVMAPTYTMGMHDADTSTKWTTSDVCCYFDGVA